MKIRFPHPFLLLLGGVVVAAMLTWILPAGVYDRVPDAALGRDVVVPGSYHTIRATPVGPLAAVIAVPRGIIAGADVVVTILFCGGAFALLDSTGAMTRLVSSLADRLRSPNRTIIVISVFFATMGALENMHEEIIAMIPVLVLLSHRIGFGAVTALAMSVGAAVVGSAFSPSNPFAAGLAMKFAELPQLSQGGLRLVLMCVALAVWIAFTIWQAPRDDVRSDTTVQAVAPATRRDVVLLLLLVAPILIYVWGVLSRDWGFNELSALFLVGGLLVGVVSGLTPTDSATGFLRGMDSMLSAALFVGIARSISVVLTDGQIIDTIVYALAAPLSQLPSTLAAVMMVPIHVLIHIPVISNSGHAVLTMPIMAPTADLLSISRDAAVMAYQTGAPLTDMLLPTNGALLAMLLKGNVSFGRWLRFALPGALLVSLVGFAGILLMQ